MNEALEPGIYLTTSLSSSLQAQAMIVRFALNQGMPPLQDSDQPVIDLLVTRDIQMEMPELAEEALDWLDTERAPDGFSWGFEPDTFPPADFGL